jgi:phage terminase large subunit
MASIVMPANGWRPRPNQQELWDYFNDPETKMFDGTSKRALMVAHRRWGKDDVALNLAGKASVVRPGAYWHMLPEYEQGRKAIWNAVDAHTGRRRIDMAFPPEWRKRTDDRGMFIEFHWGATWQVVGSDNYKSLVGAGVAGVVLSEWAKAHPGALGYLSPMLVENKGWALAITTPEGKNHAWHMLKDWQKEPGYFARVSTIDDTIRQMRAAGLEPSFTLEDVERERRNYHALYGEEAGDALIEQEYWCSFAAAILGAYYGKAMTKADQEGRICQLNVVPGYPINTAWDIGTDDPMAVWVFQVGPGWFHIIDYIEGSNVGGFEYFTKWLAERGYKGGLDFVPHDAKQHEPGASGGRTRIATLISLGRNPTLCPTHKPIDRINATRRILPHCWFDEERCAIGLECLRSFKQDWDPINRVFLKTPKHDWASHGADAFGHLAVSVEFTAPLAGKKPPIAAPPPITMQQLLKAKPERSKWT